MKALIPVGSGRGLSSKDENVGGYTRKMPTFYNHGKIYKYKNIHISMDGRSKYNKISKILEPIVGETIFVNKLWRRIMIDIGATESVIRETMSLMISLGMIREVKEGYYKVEACKADI